MSTSDVENTTPEFTVEDAPVETSESDDTTYILHRFMRDGKQQEKRMPVSEWDAYAKENGL